MFDPCITHQEFASKDKDLRVIASPSFRSAASQFAM
jgi:hypothetical protein